MREATDARSLGALAIDYAAVVDSETLEPLARVERPARALIAGRLGTTRLIDNCQLVPPAEGA
jgi:pantoate--beta-alanine ligase